MPFLFQYWSGGIRYLGGLSDPSFAKQENIVYWTLNTPNREEIYEIY